MLKELKDKKTIFFDVGYTLDFPASGDWMFTKLFYEKVGNKLNGYSFSELENAKEKSLVYLENNHKVSDTKEEFEQFVFFYSEISKRLGLHLSEENVSLIAHDRTFNMENYIAYPDAKVVLATLSKMFSLGIISDTWPSIENQLTALGIRHFFPFCTYSCSLGVFKPDERMYLDALKKSGNKAEETVFIDDSVENLEGAEKFGITPILIAVNPASDVKTSYRKIKSLSELLE